MVYFSCINLRIDCLHTIQFVLGRLTQLQECAESEREIIEVLVNLALNLVLSRLRLIAMNKCQALASFIIMLAASHHLDALSGAALPTNELLELHRSKISLHRAKAGYAYPTTRLPHTFSRHVGLSTRIYQTVYEGALAFLVIISPNEKALKSSESPALP